MPSQMGSSRCSNQVVASRQALSSTQSPMRAMWPRCSATGMNWSGASSPTSMPCHRNSASAPVRRSPSMVAWGCSTSENSSRASAPGSRLDTIASARTLGLIAAAVHGPAHGAPGIRPDSLRVVEQGFEAAADAHRDVQLAAAETERAAQGGHQRVCRAWVSASGNSGSATMKQAAS